MSREDREMPDAPPGGTPGSGSGADSRGPRAPDRSADRWMSRRSRTRRSERDEKQNRTAVVGSATVHVLAIALAWWSSLVEPRPMEFVSYEIEIVSPPSAVQAPEEVQAQPEEQLQVDRPDPEEAQPEEQEPPPVADPEEVPPPEEEQQEEEEQAPPPDPETDPDEETEAATPEPDPDAEESGEDLDVRMEGLRRDYPAYYADIVRQIQRCHRWNGAGNWDAAVYFVIRSDGTVTGIDIARPSGNLSFDLAAVAAVECAGRRLQPLPEDLPYEELPVRFNFRPPGSGEPPA